MSIKQSPNFGIFGPFKWDDFSDFGSNVRITRVVVAFGDVIDSLTTTYQTPSGPRTSPRHGGGGGSPTTFDLGPTEVIVGVYGTSGHVADEYGPSNISTLQFVILDKNTSNVRFQGPFGFRRGPNTFAMTGELVAFAGSDDGHFLQGLSFHYRSN